MDNTPRVLAGRYEVGELIGRGGMAEVHIGYDTRLGRTVAIKVLRSDLARDPSFLARFRREAQAAASLNHPAIVAVYDTGEDTYTDPTGNSVHVPFIVMEYVEGHTVRDILRDGQAVPIDEAAEITAGVLAALEYSHHAGIVHRDIKPANVMITPTGAVKVMDFGIARAVADSAATMTQTQAVIGTAQYLSPEQARGETVDARSDLYSTGCLLFELLTGRPPFIGDSPVAVAYQHVREAPSTPSALAPDVPEVLDRITLKALAKERDNRYNSAAEFRADLENAVRGGQISAPALGVAAAAAGAAMAATEVMRPAGGEPATQVMTPTAPPSPWGSTGIAAATEPPAGTPAEPGTPDDEEKKPNRKALMWTLITIGVVAVAAIIAFLVLKDDGKAPTEPTTVTVPTLPPGITEEQAQTQITAAGLVFQRVADEESDTPPGTFTKQEPAGGTPAEKGSTVTVYFSNGPNSVEVPDLTGLSLDEARQKLSDAGLTLGDTNPENSAAVPTNNVTRSDPKAGESAAANSAVDLFVSNGQVDLPNLRGLDQKEAESTIADLGLTPKVNEVSSNETEGTVLAQRPEPGQVRQGSTVEIDVAKKPEIEKTNVPTNLVGMTEQQAMEALRDAQLNLGPRQEQTSEQFEAGRVIGTDPGGGTEIEVGGDVSLIVSTGSANPEPPVNNGGDTGDGADDGADDNNGGGN